MNFHGSVFERFGPDRDSVGVSWFDQLVGGDLNMFIALISALMIILGAVLIIRPKERSAPEPWELGTLEVEMEEEMEREAAGLDEDEEYTSPISMLDVPEPGAPESPVSEESELPEDRSSQVPDAVAGELMDSDPEEVELDDLNEMADELDADDSEDEELDTSFIDDAIDERS